MENVGVSIIMPVYNVQEYIKTSLSNVVNQSYQNIEIIVVDDGSTDLTADLVKEQMQVDTRIQYIYQEKKNAGVARNIGMMHAHGKYLMFLDGDDMFDEQLVEKLYDRAESMQADLCICGADHYDEQQEEYIPQHQYLVKKMLPEQDVFSKETNPDYFFNLTTFVPWNKLYLRSFIQENNIQFQNIERVNDQYFVMLAMAMAKRITVVDECLVHYRTNQSNNLTNTFSQSAMCKYEAFCAVATTFEEMHLLENEHLKQSFVNKALNSMIYGLNIQTDITGFRKMYDILKQEGFERLGVRDYGEEFYYNQAEYSNYKNIMEYDYQSYLLVKNREYRNTIRVKNFKYNTMVKEKNSRIKEVEKELNGIKRKKWYQKMVKMIVIYHKLIGKQDDYQA